MKRAWPAVLGITVAALSGGCYSVSYGSGGYVRRGVWLPEAKSPAYKPSETIVVEGHEMHFDDQLRVYRLDEARDHFYSAGSFYRLTAGLWETARSSGGPWREVSTIQLPPTLADLPTDDGELP